MVKPSTRQTDYSMNGKTFSDKLEIPTQHGVLMECKKNTNQTYRQMDRIDGGV